MRCRRPADQATHRSQVGGRRDAERRGRVREVEGDGVVGQQPILEPGQSHEYISGCNLKTEIGKMKGTYLMERVVDGKHFKVNIPEFVMIVPYKNN